MPFLDLQRRTSQHAMSDTLPDFADEKPFEVLRSTDETDGAFVRFISTLHPAPDAEGPSPLDHPRWAADNRDEHVHPNQTETFRVRAGRYRVIYGETDRTLSEGEEVTLPAGVPHRHFNPDPEPIRIVKEDRPARQSEEFFTSIWTLAEKGYVGEDGMPPFPAFALIQNRYPGHAYLSGMPIGLQKAIFTAVAPIGRMRGYL